LQRCETPADRRALIEAVLALHPARQDDFLRCWPLWARDDQLPPPRFVDDPACGSADPACATWLVLGGRGAGKTRTGAEWLRSMALGDAATARAPIGRLALVGETFADVREVMIEGVSGLLSLDAASERPRWEAGRRRLLWPNGAVAQAFSAEEPEALRGPQFGAAWCDELAKWPNASLAWDNLQFALRLGERPRQVVTTTPRPIPLLKALAADPAVAVTRVPTAANAANLAPGFLRGLLARYEGTRLGRQELDGEFVEERPDALWRRDMIEAARLAGPPGELRRIVVAVDPPAGKGAGSRCGIIAAGYREADQRFIVLADHTMAAAQPTLWAARALALYHKLEADRLVAEVNQGGEMVRAVIAGIDAAVPVTAVRASRGKHLRAEPVAALYAQGRVLHAGRFPALEDEMCLFGPDGLADGRSPDRLDALVWAITALAEATRGRPRVREL
jgi:phage terminase large subunit-like protein